MCQSNYIPWKGYFDLIAAVDEFILGDNAKYTHFDWRNRNRIKTPQGVKWLTVPVKTKGKSLQRIWEAEIAGTAWAEDHWEILSRNYRRAPHFHTIADLIEPYYRRSYRYLFDLNRTLIEAVCGFLGIGTKLSNSWDYQLTGGKTERLANLCIQAGATEYISGPAAKAYIDPAVFDAAGVQLTWFDYSGYPEYPQLWGEFEHAVSILDLLFNSGTEAPRLMKHVLL